MEEELQLYVDDAKEKMQAAVKHLEKEFVKIRAGKASAEMLDTVVVDYYGTATPINRMANVSTSDARTIVIQPWDKTVIAEIERAIMKANLGFNPENNGDIIRINVPPLTQERRKKLVKQAKAENENAKVSVRNARKEVKNEIKELQKNGLSEDIARNAEDDIQELTKKYESLIDKLFIKKEDDIMTV